MPVRSCLALLALLVVLPTPALAQEDFDRRVEDLLAQMTLEEKVGQMTQVDLSVVSEGEGAPPLGGRAEPHRLDVEKLREALVEHHVGSILNAVNHAYTLEHWHEIIGTIQTVATEQTRLGIPILYGIDAVHGNHYALGATVFPQNIAMAATFDPALMRRTAEVTAEETRAVGIPWNFAPVLDVGRQPLWPRFYETFGEDVLLNEEMGEASILGYQGEPADLDAPDRVAATMKHYVGYSGPTGGKDRTTAHIPDRVLREVYLPPYRAGVEAGAASVMVTSGDVNGIPVHASTYLITDVLRGELGFDGVVVTDWEDVNKLHTVHRVAASPKEAARLVVEAGIDMAMVPWDFSFYDNVLALVREGALSEARIDESVRRILRMKADLGLLDDVSLPDATADELNSAVDQQLNLEAARAAITLLKNEGGTLPLNTDARVLVTGPAADSMTPLNGGWTYTWQGLDTAYVAAYPEAETVLEAVRRTAGPANVTYVPGASFDAEIDVAAAAAAAREADVALVVVGEDAYAEKPGDIDDIDLPAAQLRLAEAVAATGTPTVLVLVEGRPYVITPVVDDVEAIVMAYQPGMRGGTAVADVLFGVVNPSGKLPFTYPRSSNDLVPYDHVNSAGTGQQYAGDGRVGGFDPLYAFGHGLSYTTFAYDDLTLSASEIGREDELTVSVAVENTGDRAGAEVVQLYVRDLYASVAPAVRRLRGFEKVRLEPGERRAVTFTLTADDLSFIDAESERVVEPGDFEVQVGGLAQTFTLQ